MGIKPPEDTVEQKISGGWAAIYNPELDLCNLLKRTNKDISF
jgi:hypothetical protein